MASPDGPGSGDPRARAARTKRDRTRRALLDAADATFAARGWARTRVEDVAITAGVSAASAYNHFPSKHALVGHVFAPLVRPLITQAALDLAAGRPVVEALKDQVHALARVGWRHRGLMTAFNSAVWDYQARVAGPADPDDELDPRVLAPVPESLRGLIARGQATGELRPFPPAPEISNIVVNLLLIRIANRADESPQYTAEILMTVLFGAVCPELLVTAERADRPFAAPTRPSGATTLSE